MYEYARQGLDVEIPSRIVEIHQLATLEKEMGLLDPQSEVGLDVYCSKGTYVRSLGCDLAESIGTVGHLSVLRRLSSDGVDIERALTLPKLANLVTHEPVADWRLALSKEGRTRFARRTRPEVLALLAPFQLSPEYIFRRMPSVVSTNEESLRLAQGMCVDSLSSRLPADEVSQVLWNDLMLALLRPDGSIVRENPSIADKRIGEQPAK